jgi:hypothetical protein
MYLYTIRKYLSTPAGRGYRVLKKAILWEYRLCFRDIFYRLQSGQKLSFLKGF